MTYYISVDPSDAVPARVIYGPHRTAAVLHPAGESHVNARLTVERLRRRHYTIVPADSLLALSPPPTLPPKHPPNRPKRAPRPPLAPAETPAPLVKR